MNTYKKCLKCGAMVEVLKDCECENCGITCCGKPMAKIMPNSGDGAAEKHTPVCEINGEKLVVRVPHVMESEHFIEWIMFETENESIKKCFSPTEDAVAEFPYVKGAKVYAYCNKHGLWMAEIE